MEIKFISIENEACLVYPNGVHNTQCFRDIPNHHKKTPTKLYQKPTAQMRSRNVVKNYSNYA